MKKIEMEKEMMKRGEELLDAVGDIKDEYVVEAAEVREGALPNAFTVIEGAGADAAAKMGDAAGTDAPAKTTKKKYTWAKVLSAAAVLVLCVSVGGTMLAKKAGFNLATKEDAGEYMSDGGSLHTAPSEAGEGSGAEVPIMDYGTYEKEKGEALHEPTLEESATVHAEKESDGVINSAEEAEAEGEPEDDYVSEELEGEPEFEWTEELDPEQAEAFILTAGQWNDNANWAFFTNLVNAGRINFPSFGIDPRNRFVVTVVDEAENPLANETVTLRTGGAGTLWTAKTNKEGVAYLFVPYDTNEVPAYVECNGEMAMLEVEVVDDDSDNQQGEPPISVPTDEVTIVTSKAGETQNGLQVMFIVDTTGSMGDELAYLQMDFKEIAAATAEDGVTYSVNFYRDEGDAYITKTNGFTSNISDVTSTLMDEFAAGGGDTPEAVADILEETITNNSEWREDTNKVCFLIFDAPPHYGTESVIAEAAESAAAQGIHVVPVVASNAERETELFGRALAIVTDGEYVFLTDDSGVGESHLEPIIGDYEVELLHDVIVRIINNYK